MGRGPLTSIEATQEVTGLEAGLGPEGGHQDSDPSPNCSLTDGIYAPDGLVVEAVAQQAGRSMDVVGKFNLHRCRYRGEAEKVNGGYEGSFGYVLRVSRVCKIKR